MNCDDLDIEDFQSSEFDIIIGHIEDMLVDETFHVGVYYILNYDFEITRCLYFRKRFQLLWKNIG